MDVKYGILLAGVSGCSSVLEGSPFDVRSDTTCTSDCQVNAPIDVDPASVTDCGFTQVEETDFYRYDCNPVFTTTGEQWAPFVGHTAFHVTSVLGHPFYQLWYVGVQNEEEFGNYGFGYAVSDAGTEWESSGGNPLFNNPQGNDWDKDAMDAMQVIWDEETAQYVMLYQGINLTRNVWGMGVATSPDGLGWDFLPGNPVIDLTQPAGSVVGYAGPGTVEGMGSRAISRATPPQTGPVRPSTDQRRHLQVTLGGANGEFDDQGFVSLATAELDGTYYMFYAGFGDWQVQSNYKSSRNHFLGMATSEDGTNWTKTGEKIPVHMTQQGMVTAVATPSAIASISGSPMNTTPGWATSSDPNRSE